MSKLNEYNKLREVHALQVKFTIKKGNNFWESDNCLLNRGLPFGRGSPYYAQYVWIRVIGTKINEYLDFGRKRPLPRKE